MSRVVVWILFAVVLLGCAAAPVNLDLQPKYAAAARKAKVYIVVPQDKIVSWYWVMNSGGQFGIIGKIIDGYETSKSHQAMLKLVAPLQRVTADLDFRRDFALALASYGIVDDPANIQVVADPDMNDSAREKLVASSGGPVVFVDIRYELDQSMHSLTVDSGVSLWMSPQSSSSAEQWYLHYQSAPISPNWSWRSGDLMMPLWTANSARKYRAAYNEGIDETVKMMQLALMGDSVGVPPSQRKPYIYRDYGTQYSGKGIVIKAAPDRSIVFSGGGNLYSVSTGPTYATVESRMPPPTDGYARVFFYRPVIEGDVGWVQPSIYLNGAKLGEFSAGVVFHKDIKPGSYTLTIRYEGDAPGASLARSKIKSVLPATLIVEPSENHFVKFAGYRGLYTKTDALQIAASGSGEREIRSLRMFLE